MKTALTFISILFLSGLSLMASVSEIRGTVTDKHSNPLKGVTVEVKGRKHSVLTDTNGKYNITVGRSDSFLVFSYKGMITVSEAIKGRQVINVKLRPASIIVADEILFEDDEAVSRDITTAYPGRERRMSKAKFITGTQYACTNADVALPQFNTEGYSTIHENSFRDVTDSPLSTFSIDVDRASYSNVRRFLNQGIRPPVDAVRIEEMINYFNYNYPDPRGEHPFSVYTELAECPWNSDNYLLHIGLKGKDIEPAELPSSNLVFLIDVSGSMNSYNKLPLLKSAFGLLVNKLRPGDRVAIVVYAGAAGLVLESTPGNQKEKILSAIDRLQAGGSTAGGAGLMLAYKVAMDNFIEEGNNRIILATDGDFNVGASSNASMERLIEEKRESGIYMTVLGFGMGNYKDDKMEIIADKGNGNYAYIDNIQEARKVLVGEFGGTLFTIAEDVKFQVEFNPAMIRSYRLIGYENRLLNDEDFNDDTKDAGEMGAGHTVTAIYELVPGGRMNKPPSIDPLRYQTTRRLTSGNNKVGKEYFNIKIRYKRPGEQRSIKLEQAYTGRITPFSEASDKLRFSAAVAGFGMILRNSGHSGSITLDDIITIAVNSGGVDHEGYRSEFVRLVRTARDMQGSQSSR